MTDNSKFVIGAGISGLIYAFYNPDFTVISSDIGGKLKNDYLSATILLHDNIETRKLLRDLDLELEPKTHIMRYFYQNELLENIPLSIKELMTAKKLTPWSDLGNLNINIKITDTTLSTEDIYIPIFKTSLMKIIKLLCKQVNYKKGRVIRITDNEIITEDSRFEYTEIVSTIQAPIFWKLYGQDKNLKYIPETFVLSPTPPVSNTHLKWDLIYFLDKELPYTRVNKYGHDLYLYEFTGAISEKELKRALPDLIINHLYTDPYGILITDLNNIPPPKIRFLGRFATWNHKYKIQDVVKDAQTKYDLLSVWNKQKEFNANFFDFNVQDEDLKERLTKDFVLHVTDEAYELLREVNWKMTEHKINPVNREKLLEEWIDVFKYWLGIGNVWGFEIEEFFEAFWKKSEIVDERFRKYISTDVLKGENNAT